MRNLRRHVGQSDNSEVTFRKVLEGFAENGGACYFDLSIILQVFMFNFQPEKIVQ